MNRSDWIRYLRKVRAINSTPQEYGMISFGAPEIARTGGEYPEVRIARLGTPTVCGEDVGDTVSIDCPFCLQPHVHFFEALPDMPVTAPCGLGRYWVTIQTGNITP